MTIPITSENAGTPEILYRHTVEDPETGCWVWTKRTEPDGYVRVMRKGRKVYAHRVSFFLANGYVPEGSRVVDHVCRNRACVNPAHLEDVEEAINIARGTSVIAPRVWAALNGSCINGHVLADVGVYDRGVRGEACAQCSRDSARRYREKVPA